MNYKRLNTKSTIEDVDDKGLVKIRVSAFGNVDSYGDIMDEKAFNKSIADFRASGKTRIKHLKNHSWSELLGYPVEMESNKEGLDVVSKMNLDNDLPRETFNNYKFFAEGGQTLEHSIGYSTVKEDYSEDEKANILKEVNLMEYSTLDFLGANSETPLLDLKNMDLNTEDLIKRIETLEEKLKALEPLKDTQAVVDDEPKELIKADSELLTYLRLKNGK